MQKATGLRYAFRVCPSYRNSCRLVVQRTYSDCNHDKSKYSFHKKVAIITGGAHGIGFHIADKFLDAGARAVYLLGRDEKKGAEACKCFCEKYGPGKASYIKCDVTCMEELEASFDQAVCESCGLDIVVNNAGILNDCNWQTEIDINCKGVVHGSLLAIKHMGKNNGKSGGIVVNNASIVGLQGFFGAPVYVGTKHFVIGFNRSMGTRYYYDLTGIKFMAICPGVTITPMVTEIAKNVFPGFPKLGEQAAQTLGKLKSQGSEIVGIGTVDMIRQQKNGSMWVSEGGENYEVDIPDRKTFRVSRGNKKNDASGGSKKNDLSGGNKKIDGSGGNKKK